MQDRTTRDLMKLVAAYEAMALAAKCLASAWVEVDSHNGNYGALADAIDEAASKVAKIRAELAKAADLW